MRRLLYAVRLWLWFAARDELTMPFRWFLEAYDCRQGKYKEE